MDFYISMAVSVVLQLLKDRKNLGKYRDVMVKVASAIMLAYESDQLFKNAYTDKVKAAK